MSVLDLPLDLAGSAASLFGDGEGATAGSGLEHQHAFPTLEAPQKPLRNFVSCIC